MSAGLQDMVADGPLLVALALAACAGLVSFLSPCVLPLVPGYVSYVAGTSLGDGDAVATRRTVLIGTFLFIAGFAAIFVSYGTLFGGLGAALQEHQAAITRVLGVLIIGMGLVFAGWLPRSQSQWRPDIRPSTGLLGAPFMGATFGVGWTPCLGPTLATVQTLAFTEASAGRGAALAGMFAAGLGLPFIAVGLGMRHALRATSWVREHRLLVKRAGTAMLLGTGTLLATGLWDQLMRGLQGTIATSTTIL